MTKTLYTGGSFDVYHYGHMNFLNKCRSLADKIVVSLNTDEFIKEY
jgi:cytidyltransferase-like protein